MDKVDIVDAKEFTPDTKDLLNLLKIKGLSKYRIAKELKVSWQTVHAWERGFFSPSSERKEKLMELYLGTHNHTDDE